MACRRRLRLSSKVARLVVASMACVPVTALGEAAGPAPAPAPKAAPGTPLAPAARTVTLRVRAKGTGVALARVEVRVGGQRLFTDKLGQVVVTAAPGTKVELYRATYGTTAIELAFVDAGEAQEVFLEPSELTDNAVIVRGYRRPEVSRKTVTIEEARAVAPGGDPAQIPKLLPGVQSKALNPDIVVRGSGPNDSRYYIDRWEVPFIFHRIGNISVIPDQLLSDVEFSSGGFGAQYGDATGGVVTLRTRSEVPERAKTEVRINVPVYSSIYHERPVNEGKDLLAVSARRSYLELFLPAVLKRSGGDLTVTPYFGDEHVFYLHPTDDGYVKFLGLYSEDGIKALFPSASAVSEDGRGDFKFRNTALVFGAEVKKSLSKDWTVTTAPEILRTTTGFDVLGNHFNLLVNGAMVKNEASRRLGGKDRAYFGMDFGYGVAQVQVLAPKPDYNDPFFDFESATKVQTTINQAYSDVDLWGALDYNLGDLLLSPGIRGMYASSISRTTADPRLNFRYQLSPQQAIKGAIGQYSETPQPQDSSRDYGNPHLHFIRSYHYVLGLDTNWDERWTTDFQVFYKEIKNLVKSDAVTNTSNAGSLVSAGFEAFLRRNLTERLFGWLSYTYSKTRERNTDRETYRHAEYDQTHVLTLTGYYKVTPVWKSGGRFTYHTGDTYTGVDGAVYNANLDKYQQRTADGARPYNRRLPDYHELSIFADRDWLKDTWTLTLKFGIEYLALKPQAMGARYNYDYSKSENFQGLPPIPFIEFKGVF